MMALAAVIASHGGEIALANRCEGGLRVTITLPKPDLSAPQPADAAQDRPAQSEAVESRPV
jgi:K+-sensing histidine kinase KdpD